MARRVTENTLLSVIVIVSVVRAPYIMPAVTAEVFTAVAHIERVLDAESYVVRMLGQYIEAEEQRLDRIRRYALSFVEQYKTRPNITSEVIAGNPVRAYLLIKRLVSDWQDVEHAMDEPRRNVSTDFVHQITQFRQRNGFPNNDDLAGVAASVARLQHAYKLDTHSLVRGEIRGVKSSPALTAEDCYVIGRQHYFAHAYSNCFEWMHEALRLHLEETGNGTRLDAATLTTPNALSELYEHISYTAYKIGAYEEAVTFGRKLLEYDPQHPRANVSLVYYERDWEAHKLHLRQAENTQNASEQLQTVNASSYITKSSKIGKTDLKSHDEWLRDKADYEALCRGERTVPQHVFLRRERRLTCFAATRSNHAYWLLQPLKVEELNKHPRIVLFHDVLFEHEMHRIKLMARTRLQRSVVNDGSTGATKAVDYRISQNAWFDARDDKVVKTVHQRTGFLTGLDVSVAEALQVANYGVAGHYEAHYDFARPDENESFADIGLANRIATVLFYASDVEAGGATAFPKLDLALWPKKGAAVFWYNLKRKGDGDYRTRHGACPVLSGIKWVMNLWIHEDGQWLYNRPCGLNADD